MDAFGQFLGDRGVNFPLAFDAAQACEALRHDADTKMSLAAFPRAGVAGVLGAFVFDDAETTAKARLRASSAAARP